MKYVSLLLLLGLATTVNAADKPIARKTVSEIDITSDSFEYDQKTGVALYSGHVFVSDPQMKLRCETMRVLLPAGGGKIDNIVAEQNVVIDLTDDKGQTSHATGTKAVYSAKSDTVELTGDPKIETAQGTLTADLVLLNRNESKLQARGKVKMLLRPGALPKTSPAPESK